MDIGELFKAVLAIEGGIHPALFLLAVGALVWTVLELRKSEAARRGEYKECTEAAQQTYEKRIEEQRPVLVALERNVVALAAMTHSIDSRTAAINDLVQGFAALVNTQDVRRDHYVETIKRMESRQEENLRLTRELLTVMASVAQQQYVPRRSAPGAGE